MGTGFCSSLWWSVQTVLLSEELDIRLLLKGPNSILLGPFPRVMVRY